MRQLKLIREFMKGNLFRYLGSILAVIVTVTVGFVSPLVLEETIDGVIGQKRPLHIPGALGAWVEQLGGRDFLIHHLWIMALAILALNLISCLFGYLRGRWSAEASESIAENMRNRLYRHLQTLSYDYHVKAETGDLIQRCTSDVETIRRFLSSQVVELFRSVLMLVIALVIMLSMNVKMTLVSMILVPPLFAFAWLFFSWVRRWFKESDEAEGRMSAVLQENLTGVRVVRAFGREQYEVEKFTRVNNELHRKSKKLCDLLAVYWSGSDCLSMIQTGVTLAFGVYLAAKGEMLVGEMTVYVSYISMLLWPIRQMGRILSDMGKSMVSFDRIQQILGEKPETDDPNAIDAPIDRDIEFRHVGFEYEAKNPVLRDVSFTVKAGQTVAILGATGSGKSTLMHLLLRLYDVKRGDILIGGVSISKIRKQWLRSRIGLILQEPFLYSRTVRGNVGIVKPDATDEEIFEVTRTASAHEFIESFERGYDTVVGERGSRLSGGQKQRVAIARVFLKNPKILILDEATSALDNESEEAVQESLERLARGRTTIIIAHRLSTIKHADEIATVEHGRVVERGTHEELLARGGTYARYYRMQFEGARAHELD